jgi:hypothetical protein
MRTMSMPPAPQDLSGVSIDGLSHFNAISETEARTLPAPTRMKLTNSHEWRFDGKGRQWKRVGC